MKSRDQTKGFVIAGLAPAIHPLRKSLIAKMDGYAGLRLAEGLRPAGGSSPRMTTFVVLYAIVKTWQINAQIKT
jgi:hypothetical protein